MDIALVAALVEAATRIMELVVEARMLCVLLSFFVRFGTRGQKYWGWGCTVVRGRARGRDGFRWSQKDNGWVTFG